MSPVSDLDIYRTAKVIINGHGGSALYLANSRREDCLDLGDQEGADTWARVIKAIEFLQSEKKPESEGLQ